jgi:hypothetical protein
MSVFEIESNHRVIPSDWQPTKMYSIMVEGWNAGSLNGDNSEWIRVLLFASKIFHSFVDLYKNTHAFTDPQLSYRADGTIFIKFGTMENELYERISKKSK